MPELNVTPQGLRDYAKRIEEVWTEFADEDLITKAVEASDALTELAIRIENGE